MTKITLYTRSNTFFNAIKNNIGELVGDIELEHENSDEDSIQCNEGEVHAMVSSPVRIGAVLDQILMLISNSGEQFIQAKSIEIGLYILHPRDMSLESVEGKSITLTEKERDMILCIYRQDRHEIEKSVLLSSVWGYGDNIETHTLETHIYRLRQKVECDPSQPKWLVTTDNGYKIVIN